MLKRDIMASNMRRDEVAVAIMHLDEFMKSLPRCFKRNKGGRIYHNPDDANLFLDERNLFINSLKKISKINNIQEFAILKERLLSVPTYLSVTLSKDDIDLENNTGTWHHFMVCLNPKHPSIRNELEENLSRCEELLSKGKHFSFFCRLGPSLRRWYEIVNEVPYYGSRSFNSTICITNFVEECYMCYSPILWTTLFPVMLLICGPYIVYRAIACKEFSFRVTACITLVIGNVDQGSARRDHLCVVKHRPNPLVTSTTQQPSLCEIACSDCEDQNRRKYSTFLFRPF